MSSLRQCIIFVPKNLPLILQKGTEKKYDVEYESLFTREEPHLFYLTGLYILCLNNGNRDIIVLK